MSAIHNESVTSSIWYLKELEIYKTIKPYHLAFEPADSIPRTNIEREEIPVSIIDLRCLKEPCSFHQNGFTVLTLDEIPVISNWDDEKEVSSLYYPFLEKRVSSIFHDARCNALTHQVRRRDLAFPISTGQNYKHSQPVRVAHVDVTASSAEQIVRQVLGEEADLVLSGRYIYMKCWRPIQGPNRDWPLALCDVQSVNSDLDLEIGDYVSPFNSRENCMLYHRENHRWYYLSDQTIREGLLFRQYDSDLDYSSGISPNPPLKALYNYTK